MLSQTVFLLALGACCAASMEKREGLVAEARDGAHHAAPAPASYDTGSTGSQGNLYYYYYPVQEYGSTEASTDFDIFTAIILPLLILGGLLLLLSSLTFTLTTGRKMSNEKEDKPQLMEQLHAEIERVFYAYLKAFESEQCIQRTVCEMGAYSRNLEGKEFVLGLIEPLVPEGMKGNMLIFKKAALAGQETGKCNKYKCVRPKLL